jgi:hypothetical protein
MTTEGDRFDRLAVALLDRLLALQGEDVRERQRVILAVEIERIDRGAYERGKTLDRRLVDEAIANGKRGR